MRWFAAIVAFVGRLLIALLFIGAGLGKFADIPGTAAYMETNGLPPMLAMPTAAFEVIGGILLLIGLFTRPLAILFAAFTLTTILFFHGRFSDPVQMAMATKNLAIAGGLLILFAYSNVAYSFDSLRARRKADREINDAELRAAKAEGRAEIMKEERYDRPEPRI